MRRTVLIVLGTAMLAAFVGSVWFFRRPDEPHGASAARRQAEEPDATRVERALVAVLGEDFSFVGASPETHGRLGPLWVAALRANRAGDFVLRCDLNYDVSTAPNATPRPSSATLKYWVRVAPANTPRAVAHGQYNATVDPLACVGDEILIPVPVGPGLTGHRFRLSPERSPEDLVRFQSARETGDALRRIEPVESPVPLHFDAVDDLRPVTVSVHASDSRGKNGPVLNSYGITLDVLRPGRYRLVTEIDPWGPFPASNPPPVNLDITEGSPVRQAVLQWGRQENGPGALVSSQTDTYEPATLALRVGDRVSLFAGRVQTSGPPPRGPRPALTVRKEPSGAPSGAP